MDKVEIAYRKGYRVSPSGIPEGPFGNKLRASINNYGYALIKVRINGSYKNIPAHRLQAFIKFRSAMFENGIQVRHLNGNSLDNSWDNIAIGTASQNNLDKRKDVRMRAAMKAASRVRKYDRKIVKMYYEKHGWSKTMYHFGITSKGTLHFILNGKKAS